VSHSETHFLIIMKVYYPHNYKFLEHNKLDSDNYHFIYDHLCGFDENYNNSILQNQNQNNNTIKISTKYIFNDIIKKVSKSKIQLKD